MLGPLDLWVDGSRIDIQRGRQQALLATLLLHANRVVAVDRLIRCVWGADAAPRNPEAALHTCVTRGRKLLDRTADPQRLIERRGCGYLLRASPAELDLLEYRALVRQAAAARTAGELRAESDCLESALALWNWPILPDVASDYIREHELPALSEEWLAVVERRAEVELALGRHHGLVSDLTSMTASFPYHEGLWRARMLALYHSGRQTEALQSYQEFTTRIRDEYGVDPGSELEKAYLAILRGGAVR